MSGYVAFLIALWLGIIAMLAGLVVVLLAVFGGGAALCVVCRRLTGLRRRSGGTKEVQKVARPNDKDGG